MRQLVAVIGVVNLGLFTLAGIVAVRLWRRDPRNRAGLWAALAFADLAFVVVFSRAIPDEPDRLFEHVAQRLDVAILVLFPYLLYRFTTAFETPPLRLERLLALLTVIVVTATLVLPYFPAGGEARPWWFVLYLLLFLVHWSILLILVAVRLWRAGRDQASVARKRMRTLAIASVAITGALFLAAAAPDPDSVAAVVVGVLASVSAGSFLIGLAPPAALRLLWRRPEQEQLRLVTSDLMSASDEQEVAARVVVPTARIVGAEAAAIYEASGRLIGSHGTIDPAAETTTVRFDAGRLVVQTTAFAPYFGDEERKLLHAVGALTGLALDRARLFAQERAAREALERADVLKTQFVALAAHELRSPVTAIYGFAETLRRRGRELAEAQRVQMEEMLYDQVERLSSLVGQLLDLSRLEADAVEIKPQRVALRETLEEIVAAAAPGQSVVVSVEDDSRQEAFVDLDALDRIVSNLVVNALRYGEPPVSVSAGNRSEELHVTVEDRGSGVPSELVPQLFERFARGRPAGERPSGTGLGLAIARSYARAHRGELRYRPATPHGAAFELVLPTPAA